MLTSPHHNARAVIDKMPNRCVSTTGTHVGARFQRWMLDAIGSGRKAQEDLPTRPEALGRLVAFGKSCGPTELLARLLHHEDRADSR
jgi:hypothetical protein